ncbi:hypothetical protein M8818_001155 [Zalaria obscura]|uniref:Uncharacterized protein n=1 Tax=Zalaria obscura TaxID=2024903 RepID=A0ACC3SKC4_9PEZI
MQHGNDHQQRPFRPGNTLSSPKKPVYNTASSDIGNDSSLFDSTDDSSFLDHFVPQPVGIASPAKKQGGPGGYHIQAPVYKPRVNMVNERDPPATTGAPRPASPQKADRQPLVPVAHTPLPKPTQQAEFGKASPIRNPLRDNYSNLFNVPKPGQKRAEHHRPAQPPSAFYLPGQKPRPSGQPQPHAVNPPYQPVRPAGTSAAQGQHLQGHTPADAIEISSPRNKALPTIFPPARPIYSSLGSNTTYESFFKQPNQPPRNVVDLTKTDDNAFDPDAALRADKFGAVDPYSYVDAGQASQNIKELLEGAFDDDDDKPKHRLRKRAKKAKPAIVEKKVASLADKLAALEVKDEPKEEPEKEEEEEEEEEDGTVEGLVVKLLPHQVEGVAWMLDKEIGERKKNGVLPKGGILADDMGLGKTVQSVALILTNPRPPLDAKADPDHPKRKFPGKEVGKGTLVVAPLALIKQWESEIKTKVEDSHALKVLVHHGPNRTKSHLELKKYDVVITTYQILASEHAGSFDGPDGIKVGCFGVHWYRVILDEAHSIKNRNAKSTQACYALRSWYRWCLTGTPMQNNLDELQSLIRFLAIKPYNELGPWKDQISTPMKNGKGHIAIKRIQYFLKAFMKRRTKDILKAEGALNFGGKAKEGEKKEGMKIVRRDVEIVSCVLDDGEREFYDRLQERAEKRLKDMMGEKTDYIGALVLLLRLRQACNHPRLIESTMGNDKDALALGGAPGLQSPRKGSKVDDDADDLANMLGGLSVATKTCDVCQVELSSSEAAEGDVRCKDCEADLALQRKSKKHHKSKKPKKVEKKVQTKPVKMRNRKVITDSDDEDAEGGGEWLTSEQSLPGLGKAGGTDDEDAEGGGDTLGSIDSVTDDEEADSASETESDAESDYYSPSTDRPSTKVRHLLRILRAETPEHKTIVFSSFTSMLDIIEPHLRAARLSFVRYDGSMRPDAREASLHSLRNDPHTRVLLCSLKCGSLGLNLTAASRVVLIEPFWNPFVEEQAIDRVHRLNQTVDVKVFRLTVADTVEERILKLQEKKRELAKAAIEGGKAGAKLSMRDILGLFGREAEAQTDAMEGMKWMEKEKVLEAGPKKGVARPTPGVSVPRDPRRGGMESRKPRVSNEDSVYGRRW